ncbi:A disintegrin and metalloproteinase with thrombospondin motifs 6-like isoform X2 [Mercenaria mercenaria]|uniref:A disintegrin and metalloproteinase with thrombospondin motifs 6-like isoform X2 n=1 Tax=Mercenaria mercenaria TaxID=6596 RepID=UPI00234FAFC1|nr:A disintegrin and metalloproteinase with thrombospondin motifs 6-like isoform X2 [Mercenaria mercenaria]
MTSTFQRFCLVSVIFSQVVLHGYCFQSKDKGRKSRDRIVEVFTNATDRLLDCRYPDYFQMRIHLPGQHDIVLNLRKHPSVSNRFPPTYLLSRLPRQDSSVENDQQDFVRYTSVMPDSHILAECQHVKKSKLLYISGVILYEGKEYVVQSLKPRQTTGLGLIFARLHELIDTPRTHDYIISEKSRLLSVQETGHSSRDRREVMRVADVLTFTIDVLVVVDYNVYIKWLSNVAVGTMEERSLQAKKEIQKYYLHVINGVDLRYHSIGFDDFQIRVNLSGIVIIDNLTSLDESAFEATPPNSSWDKETNEMDADTALKLFRSWVNDTTRLPKHNHAVLFTGYDLYTSRSNGSNQKQTHTSGLAFIGTLCEPGDSVSIVEEQGGFQSIGTAAHEIGHRDGSTCLTDRSSNNTEVTEAKTSDLDLPGQHYSPDEQCRLIWGQTSYLCRGPEFGNASTICTAMYCRDPSTESDCVLHTAARGTTCGNKQWCMGGHCVHSTKAPARQEPCVLGDQPGPAFNSMTCEELIAKSPSYCYQEKVRARCCNTCWSKYTYRKGCEYGDRIQGCRLWHCSHFFESRDIQTECCGTCEIGELIEPSDFQRFLPTEKQLSTVSPAKWTSDTCTDTSAFSCSDYIRSRGPFVCYSNVTAENCCKSCREIKRKDEGCEYGDRVPSLCANMKNVTELDCAVYGKLCCSSCVSFTFLDPTSSSSHFIPSIGMIIYKLIFMLIVMRWYRL